MIERILEIIRQKNLTPSQFAEEIGIQRSSISHLVSGRNKPSLEFIQKILIQFPDISSEWLLSGTGSMMKAQMDGENATDTLPPAVTKTEKNPSADEYSLLFDADQINEPEVQPKTDSSRQIKKKNMPAPEIRQIEKIVYFYKDMTFREYYPDNA